MLDGLRVLDLSRLLPGPYCTLVLAQLGAEVIKIEEPGQGDYARTLSPELFALVNRGKQSITLDLRQAEGVAVLKRLVGDAEVLLESFRPGVMDRLGCDYDTLKAINPKLVYCALTGYGQTGPWRDRAGHDMNYCGYAGALDQSGSADGPPALANTQLADLAGGALTAAVGILAAVLKARASGTGRFVDIAMLDGTLALQALSVSAIRTLGRAEPRGQGMLSGGLPNYAVYECADGKHVAMAALEPKFFLNFCKRVERPDLARLPLAAGAKGEPLRAALRALFKTRPRDEWEALLGEQDCCVSAILNPDEALVGAQLQARGMLGEVDGKPVIESAVQTLGVSPRSLNAAPALGADTQPVLAAHGFDAARLAALKARRVI